MQNLSDQQRIQDRNRALAESGRAELQKICNKMMDIINDMEKMDHRVIKSHADYLMETIRANVDNKNLTDSDFREFVRNSLSGIAADIDQPAKEK
jgi:hypothetical protein